MSSNVRDAVSRVRNKSDYYDHNLLAAVILLTCFGLVMLYSTSAYMAELKFGNDMYYFKKQALISLACILLAILVSFVDYHVLSPLGGVIFLAAFILMALVQTPLGVEVNGARRWLNLGIQFQPSEVAKIAVIVFVPIVIVRMGRRFQGLKACIFPLALGLVLGFGAYKFTENLSTAIIIVGIACVIVFIAHPRTAPFVLIMVAAVVVVGAAIFILSQTIGALGPAKDSENEKRQCGGPAKALIQPQSQRQQQSGRHQNGQTELCHQSQSLYNISISL